MAAALVSFLEHCSAVQDAADAAIEKVLAKATPVAAATSRSANVGHQVGDVLSLSDSAVQHVQHIAFLHLSAAPLAVPADCLTLRPSAAFLTLYQHVVECVLQATQSLVLLSSSRSKLPAEESSCQTRTAELIDLSETNSKLLTTLTSSSDASSPLGFTSVTPLLMSSWIRVALRGDIEGGVRILAPHATAAMQLHSFHDKEVDYVDLLNLSAMYLQLWGKPEQALPLLSVAHSLAERLRNSACGWKCARGCKSQILSLLLRAECKRVLHQKDSSYPDWLDDARSASKLSSDESRQFAGVAVSSETCWATSAEDGGGLQSVSSTRNILPRMLHKMVHMYCGGLFPAISNEIHSQADILGRELCCESNETARLTFWYDLYSMLAPHSQSTQSFLLCCALSAPHSSAVSEEDPHSVAPCAEQQCGASDMDARFHSVFLHILQSISSKAASGRSFCSNTKISRRLFGGCHPMPAHGRPEGRDEVVPIDGCSSTDAELKPGGFTASSYPSTSSLPDASQPTNASSGSIRVQPSKPQRCYAFSSSFSVKSSEPKCFPPNRSQSLSARLNRTVSSSDVFDRLTTGTPRLQSSTSFTSIPSSARSLLRPSSAKSRSNSSSDVGLKSGLADSKLATSVRGRVASSR